MSAAVEHTCVDCRAEATSLTRRPRKIANPGDGAPRCTTHLRRFTTRQRQQARGRRVERTYEISAKDAGQLLVAQKGRCWICGKATGASKLLAVDHDHADDWVRGRLCSTCNQFIGRQLDDDPDKALNLVSYLQGDTPYRRLLASRWVLKSYGVQPSIDDVRVQLFDGGIVIHWRESGQLWNANYNHTLDELLTYAEGKSS